MTLGYVIPCIIVVNENQNLKSFKEEFFQLCVDTYKLVLKNGSASYLFNRLTMYGKIFIFTSPKMSI